MMIFSAIRKTMIALLHKGLVVWLFLALASTAHGERRVIDRAAVVVNNKVITEQELKLRRELLENEIRAQSGGAKQEARLKELRETLLDRMVENLLLESRAESMDIKVSDSEIDDRVGSLLKSDPRIADSYSDQQLRELIVKDLLRKRVIQAEIQSRIAVSEKEIKDFCHAMQGDSRQIDVGHILLRTASPESVKKLNNIRSQLLAGADFEKMAGEHSQDPSVANNKGRLGFISRGQFVKEFEDKAFQLKVGELSDPVQTQFGVHLIKIFAEREAKGGGCEKMDQQQRRQYHEMLWSQKLEKRQTEYFQDLRKKAEIRILVKG